MRFRPALLEEWMRDYYYTAQMDIGSSGVACWSLGELRSRLGITQDELDRLVLQDSTSFGQEALRQAISERFGNGDPDWVMVTHGSSEAIFLAMTSLLGPEDEIVVVHPGYHSHASIAKSIGCRVKEWRLSEEHGFAPNVDELRQVVSPQTRMVALNFPHNPTGVTLTAEQLKEVISIVSEAGAYLLWDAVFHDLVYETDPLPDPVLSYERTISVNTFSKAYGLPGLRFGWCLAAPEVLNQFIPLRDRLTLHLSPLIEFLALRTIMGLTPLLEERVSQARHNLGLLENWVEANREFVEWTRPQGGVTAFPRLKTKGSVEELCHELGRDHGVLLVPGSCFDTPDRVRLGFGGSTEELTAALAHLEALLQRSDTE